jgi:uncharacterized repeat protein (TIGR03809 family)
LFESGRWRRYHSERAFLENIKEAKSAVETWRGLSTAPVVKPPKTISAAQSILRRALEPKPAIAPEPIELPKATEIAFAAREKATPVADLLARTLDMPSPALDFAAIEQRYPLLRNSL